MVQLLVYAKLNKETNLIATATIWSIYYCQNLEKELKADRLHPQWLQGHKVEGLVMVLIVRNLSVIVFCWARQTEPLI